MGHHLNRLRPFFFSVVLFFITRPSNEQPPTLMATLLKCLPILCLVCFIEPTKKHHYHDPYRRRILLGLIMSALGDAFLVWDSSSVNFLYAGVVSFGLAHVFYIWAFVRSCSAEYVSFAKGAPFVCACFLTLMLFWQFLDGAMLIFGSTYIIIICCMAWTAFHFAVSAPADIEDDNTTENGSVTTHSNDGYRLCAFVGAILFMISDLMVGLDMYHVIKVPAVFVMSTYYASQACIAMSVNHQIF